jgi:hypothetical protein
VTGNATTVAVASLLVAACAEGSGPNDAGARPWSKPALVPACWMIASATRSLSGYAPTSLESILTGEGGYAAVASIVAYIDSTYGRAKLRGLVRATSTAEALSMLSVSEDALLEGWSAFAR